MSSFFCAMIAAITLKMLDPFGTGKLVLFQVTYDKVRQIRMLSFLIFQYTIQDWHAFELFFFVILGVLGVSTVFS
jgi:chloride channel 3/4/5